jgi:hypothetical protein
MPCSDVDANRQFLLAHVEQVIYNRYEATVVGSSPVRTESGETSLLFRIASKIGMAAISAVPRGDRYAPWRPLELKGSALAVRLGTQ